MAPNRGSSTAGHKGPKKSGNKGSSSKASKGGTLKPKSDSKSRVSKKGPKAPPPKQQKTRPGQVVKKKKRVYTDKELGLPQLNMITPVGVQKPKGKKKGKVFVDDAESMMTILAMVNADKEGQIESKMMKARHLEAIREARKAEAEAREAMKKGKLEDTKDSLRKKRNRKSADEAEKPPATILKMAKPKKKVSFG